MGWEKIQKLGEKVYYYSKVVEESDPTIEDIFLSGYRLHYHNSCRVQLLQQRLRG